MLSGFYKYIAKRAVSFFQTQKDIIRPGERYCLRLDTEEMVKGVDQALHEYVQHERIEGSYIYEEQVYSTFTVRLSDNIEVVVASKMAGMTDDFLTALRNTQRTDKRFPILMIAYSPNDSVVSGTQDLSSKGMPFHAAALTTQIRQDLAAAQLSAADAELLRDELERREGDRFSDHSSLFEYADLLMVLDRGYIEPEDYHLFGLLEDPDGSNLVDPPKIRERLKKNRDLFDQIDQAVKEGNVDDDLDGKFDGDFIRCLNQRRRSGQPWYEGQTLEAVVRSQAKIQRKLNNPLEISDESFEVYSDSAIVYRFPINEMAFIRADGTTKAKSRNKNILIYNPDHRSEVTVAIHTNIAVKPSWIEGFGAAIVSAAKCIQITMKPTGCSFSKTSIIDSVNGVKYTIKICILDVARQYLESIHTAFILAPKKGKSVIQVLGVEKELVINPGQSAHDEAVMMHNGQYRCDFDHTLALLLHEGSILPDMDHCEITLKCGAVSAILHIKDEAAAAKPLTGLDALSWKFASERRMEYRGEKLVAGTDAFFTRKGQFQESLALEAWILEHEALAVDLTMDGYAEHTLQIPLAVRDAYIKLLQSIKARRQLPSLVQYTGEVKEAAEDYITAVTAEFAAVPQVQSLEKITNDLLQLGCVMQTHGEQAIMMSPLHPLNVQYQLRLLQETGIGTAHHQILEKITPLNLIPYIRDPDRQLYHAVEQKHSPEWRFYAPASNKRYQGARNFLPKLVCNKIEHYKSNFSFLFEDIGNNCFYINLVNMGDCREVLEGLARYYAQHLPSENPDQFVVNIYGTGSSYNAFSVLGDQRKLLEFVRHCKNAGDDANELAQTLVGNIRWYFRPLTADEYEYAHLTFYEMDSSNDFVSGHMENIAAGISLGGLTSGVPSVLDHGWYKTGFGQRFAPHNELTQMAAYYNALYHVAFSGSTYDPRVCTFTEIEKNQEGQLGKIYRASNWVVFVSPKVDLSFFQKKSSDRDELMIIHYSDQYTSASGYDDITVTQKSQQYYDIICEQLQKRNVCADAENIDHIINMFNAINGSWMLRLISAKKMSGAADSYFSREKMSILSAIKFCMAYYAHDDIVWVPVSLEEVLRVSGTAGLSQKEGLLSGKNLGFANGPTCDDILMVGINTVSERIKIYLYPVEVKIGQNTSVYGKAREQVLNTYNGLWNALWPTEHRDALEHKVTRNFFMQVVLVCCEKMKLYKIVPETPWDRVLEQSRQALLNEEYEFSHALDTKIGKGAIVSFKTEIYSPTGTNDGDIILLEFPEKLGADFMIKTVCDIERLLSTIQADLPRRLKDDWTVDINSEDAVSGPEMDSVDTIQTQGTSPETIEQLPQNQTVSGMEILLGREIGTGQPLYWTPNDTNQIFHTNTGIIGTMGTGKTQFTKSMITQLYREQNNNFAGRPLGILIFDYKGDYNESKADFVQMTDARVLKPYQLPFNPLALTRSSVFRPLLPVHTANAFKDTLSKVYGLGPKQENNLFDCIIKAYNNQGIFADQPDSWDRTPPTVASVYAVYMNNDEIKKTDSLASAMNKMNQFQLFERDPQKTTALFDLLTGVVVIDLSGYDSDIQSLIVAITLDLFYAQMQAAGSSRLDHQYRELTKLILVDEADNFMSERFPALKKILKEGREFGVGTILSTQFLKHFGSGEDDYSKYILTWIVHNVSDLRNSDVEFVFKTEAKSQETQELFQDIKGLQKHHSIVKIGNAVPRYIKDRAFWKLYQELGQNY